jgi:putative SOS response-associated peptidase YedK
MCGRFAASSPPSVIAEKFEVKDVPELDLSPRWNVAPTMDALVVTRSEEGERAMDALRWGLVPWWADSPAIGSKLINARAESVASSRAFRSALSSRRCIVPVDGFYEWKPLGGGTGAGAAAAGRQGARKGGGSGRVSGRAKRASRRQPYFVRASGGGLLALAGLWERWRDAEGNWLRSFTIVTTPANSLLEPIHDRMPAVLPPEAWEAWLDGAGTDASAARALLGPCPPEAVEAVPVSELVNSPRNDGAELVERVEAREG